jgi:hypothetical protein
MAFRTVASMNSVSVSPWLKHGLKFGAQLWLDADLGYDGGLHARSVLRMGYEC